MEVQRFLKHFVIIALVIHIFTDTFGSFSKIEGISMQPTLNPNGTVDFVYLSYFEVYFDWIKTGDIVVVKSPRNSSETIIKRVIGVEGDIINIDATNIITNAIIKLIIPKGHYWIEGDHKGYTYDSTYFGPIPKHLIVAKVPAIVWPPNRWQLI